MRVLGIVIAVSIALLCAGSSFAERGIWLTAPLDGTTLPAGEPVTLEFGTDWRTGVFPGRLRLEVARDPLFTDLVVQDIYVCPASFEPSCPSTATIGPLDDSPYFWRILWYSQPDGLPTSWVPSDTWTFRVGSSGPPPTMNQPPVARIAFTPAHPRVGELVSFDGSASTDADGAISSYSWAFGNGNGAAGSPLAAAAFDQPGTYLVTLVVADNAGLSAAASVEVTLETPTTAPPPAPPIGPPASHPPAAADTSPPITRALPSEGRPGGLVKLWYRVRDASGTATVEAVVRSRQRVLTTLRSRVAANANVDRFFLWRAPRRAERLTLCVRARDGAGNRSTPSCAPLWIR